MHKFKEDLLKLLMGMSTGLVVALIPVAILGEISKATNIELLTNIVMISQSLLSIVMGVTIAKQFDLDPIESSSLAITSGIASGALSFNNGSVVIKGVGDVINAGLIALLAIYLMRYVGSKIKAYRIMTVPLVSIVLCGLIGIITLPYVSYITIWIAHGINWLSSLNLLLACILISVSFAFLIVSPASTAAVAIMVGLTGTVSGAANLGICAAAFSLGLASYKTSGFGISAAHILASPKLQLSNFVAKPKMIIPTLLNAVVCGVVAYVFNIYGTSSSAGFGISGLIGPLAHLGYVGFEIANVIVVVFSFIIIPLCFAYIFNKMMINNQYLKDEDFKIKM